MMLIDSGYWLASTELVAHIGWVMFEARHRATAISQISSAISHWYGDLRSWPIRLGLMVGRWNKSIGRPLTGPQGCAPEKTEFAERTSLHLAGVDYPTKASAKGGRDARQ